MLRLVTGDAGIQEQVVLQSVDGVAGAVLHHLAIHHDGHMVLVDGVFIAVGGPHGKGQVAIGQGDHITAQIGADLGGVQSLLRFVRIGHGSPVVDDIGDLTDDLRATLEQKRDLVAAQRQPGGIVLAGGGDPSAVGLTVLDTRPEVGVVLAVEHLGHEGEHAVLQLLLGDGLIPETGGNLGLGLLVLVSGAVAGGIVIGLVLIGLRILSGIRLVHGDLVRLWDLLGRGVVLGLRIVLLGRAVARSVTGRAVLGLGLLIVAQTDLVDVQSGILLCLGGVRLRAVGGQGRPAARCQRQGQHQTYRAGNQHLLIFLHESFHCFVFSSVGAPFPRLTR